MQIADESPLNLYFLLTNFCSQPTCPKKSGQNSNLLDLERFKKNLILSSSPQNKKHLTNLWIKFGAQKINLEIFTCQKSMEMFFQPLKPSFSLSKRLIRIYNQITKMRMRKNQKPKKAGLNLQFIAQKEQNYPQSIPQEKVINQFVRSVLINGRALESPCLGCIDKISHNSDFFECKTFFPQNFVSLNWPNFEDPHIFLKYICSMLNANGGFLFVCEKMEKQVLGYSVSSQKKKVAQKYIKQCLNYIGPKIINGYEILQVDFLPVTCETKSSKIQKQVVIRIKINPVFQPNQKKCALYYVDYKGGSGGKQSINAVYDFDAQKKDILEINSSDLYPLILQKNIEAKRRSSVNAFHEGDSCIRPKLGEQIFEEQIQEDELVEIRKSFVNFKNHSVIIFDLAASKTSKSILQKIENVLHEKKIVYQIRTTFQKDFKLKKGVHQQFFLFSHNETHETIKQALMGVNQVFFKVFPLFRKVEVYVDNMKKKLVNLEKKVYEKFASKFKTIHSHQDEYTLTLEFEDQIQCLYGVHGLEKLGFIRPKLKK